MMWGFPSESDACCLDGLFHTNEEMTAERDDRKKIKKG